MLRQRDGRGDQALQRGQRARVEFLGRQRGGQAAGVGDQPRHQPLAERIVRGGGKEVVMAEPGGDPRAGDVGPMRERRRLGGDAIHSDTSARARSRAASVPSARRSRSQVKPCAAASSRAEPDASPQRARPQRHARRRRIPARRAAARAPRPGSPGQGSRTGRAGASGTRPMRRLGRRAIARRASRSQRRGSDALIRPALAAQRGDRRRVVRRAEHGGAGDQRVGAGGDHARRRLGRDAAIHRQRDRAARGVDHPAQRRDLRQLRRQECLPAESGIDRHHQDDVDEIEHPRNAFRPASPGFSTTPARLPCDADELQRAMQMRSGLRMHQHDGRRRRRRTPRCRDRPARSSGARRTAAW